MQQFLVILVADFPVVEAVILVADFPVIYKQSDVGELDRIRKIVAVSQKEKRSQNCVFGYT